MQLIFFSPERTDARSIKRIEALQAQGWNVLGFTFHRAHVEKKIEPTWEDVCLGVTYSRRYLQRCWAVLSSLVTLWRYRKRTAAADCLYAINADNALLALFARMVCGRRVPLALEIADIQPAMMRPGLIGIILRTVERAVLRRSALLITTSPGFVRHYFQPVQHYSGPTFMLENKVWPAPEQPATTIPGPRHPGRPWVIGYFGVFRCQRSLELIRQLAIALPETVRFYLRGVPGGLDPDYFAARIKDVPGIHWEGGYRYHQDLPGMYSQVDLNWCYDFSAAGENSAWLLPNRIYEGGLYQCPALALQGTETASWIMEKGLGWSLPEDLADSLRTFLLTLTPAAWHDAKARCIAAPVEWFAGPADYAALSARLRELQRQE